jgi:hypothetical protein
LQKKKIHFGGGVLRRAVFASNDSLEEEAEDLGLFLLPNGRPRCHFTSAEEETAMEAARVAAPTLFHHDTSV